MDDLKAKPLHRDPDALLLLAAVVALVVLAPDWLWLRVHERAQDSLVQGLAFIAAGGRFALRINAQRETARTNREG